MRGEVEAFLSKLDRDEAEALRRKREKHLIALGLCRTEFLDDVEKEQGPEATAGVAEEYPSFQDGRRCRILPLEVTEEEYTAICTKVPEGMDAEDVAEAREKPAKKPWPVWPVDKILFVLAMVVYGVGLILGIDAGYTAARYGSFSLTMAASTWLSMAIYGSLVLAASEVVRLMKKNAGER